MTIFYIESVKNVIHLPIFFRFASLCTSKLDWFRLVIPNNAAHKKDSVHHKSASTCVCPSGVTHDSNLNQVRFTRPAWNLHIHSTTGFILANLLHKIRYTRIYVVAGLNSLGPSDAIWWHRSGLTLVTSMACCLTASSHYLNQFWLDHQ